MQNPAVPGLEKLGSEYLVLRDLAEHDIFKIATFASIQLQHLGDETGCWTKDRNPYAETPVRTCRRDYRYTQWSLLTSSKWVDGSYNLSLV